LLYFSLLWHNHHDWGRAVFILCILFCFVMLSQIWKPWIWNSRTHKIQNLIILTPNRSTTQKNQPLKQKQQVKLLNNSTHSQQKENCNKRTPNTHMASRLPFASITIASDATQQELYLSKRRYHAIRPWWDTTTRACHLPGVGADPDSVHTERRPWRAPNYRWSSCPAIYPRRWDCCESCWSNVSAYRIHHCSQAVASVRTLFPCKTGCFTICFMVHLFSVSFLVFELLSYWVIGFLSCWCLGCLSVWVI